MTQPVNRHETTEALKDLLFPFFPALYQVQGVASPWRTAKNFEEFKQLIMTAAATNDGKSWSNPYAALVNKGQYQELLRLFYCEVDPNAPLASSSWDLESALREFKWDLIRIDAHNFVSRQMMSDKGRTVLRGALRDIEQYTHDYDPEEDSDLDILTMRSFMGAIEFMGESYLDRDGFMQGLFFYTDPIQPDELDAAEQVIAAVEALHSKKERPEQIAVSGCDDMVAALSALSHWAKDDSQESEEDSLDEDLLPAPVAEDGRDLTAHLKDYIQATLNDADHGLIAQAKHVTTVEEFIALHAEIEEFLRAAIDWERDGASFYDGVADGIMGVGLDSLLVDLFPAAVMRQPFDDLLRLHDEVAALLEMEGAAAGKRIRITAPTITAKGALGQGIQELIAVLNSTKRGLWYSYKQHSPLARVASTTAQFMEMGDRIDIERATSFIDVLIDRLATVKDEAELLSLLEGLFASLERGGIVETGFQAAEYDGMEGLYSNLETALQIIAASLTLSAGAVLLARVNALKNTVTGIERVRQSMSPASRAFLWGGYVSLSENAVGKWSGGVRHGPDTVLAWLKDALAVGLSSALTGFLPPLSAGDKTILHGLWQRYTASGFQFATTFSMDASTEILEELVENYVREVLDGNWYELTAAEFEELAKGCIAGGFLNVSTVAEAIALHSGSNSPETAGQESPLRPEVQAIEAVTKISGEPTSLLRDYALPNDGTIPHAVLLAVIEGLLGLKNRDLLSDAELQQHLTDLGNPEGRKRVLAFLTKHPACRALRVRPLQSLIHGQGKEDRFVAEAIANGLDAMHRRGVDSSIPLLVEAKDGLLIVRDPGLGMNLEIIAKNFLLAHNSGTRGDGIGHFGMGAKQYLGVLQSEGAFVRLITQEPGGLPIEWRSTLQNGVLIDRITVLDSPLETPGTVLEIHEPTLSQAELERAARQYFGAARERPILSNAAVINPMRAPSQEWTRQVTVPNPDGTQGKRVQVGIELYAGGSPGLTVCAGDATVLHSSTTERSIVLRLDRGSALTTPRDYLPADASTRAQIEAAFEMIDTLDDVQLRLDLMNALYPFVNSVSAQDTVHGRGLVNAMRQHVEHAVGQAMVLPARPPYLVARQGTNPLFFVRDELLPSGWKTRLPRLPEWQGEDPIVLVEELDMPMRYDPALQVALVRHDLYEREPSAVQAFTRVAGLPNRGLRGSWRKQLPLVAEQKPDRQEAQIMDVQKTTGSTGSSPTPHPLLDRLLTRLGTTRHWHMEEQSLHRLLNARGLPLIGYVLDERREVGGGYYQYTLYYDGTRLLSFPGELAQLIDNRLLITTEKVSSGVATHIYDLNQGGKDLLTLIDLAGFNITAQEHTGKNGSSPLLLLHQPTIGYIVSVEGGSAHIWSKRSQGDILDFLAKSEIPKLPSRSFKDFRIESGGIRSGLDQEYAVSGLTVFDTGGGIDVSRYQVEIVADLRTEKPFLAMDFLGWSEENHARIRTLLDHDLSRVWPNDEVVAEVCFNSEWFNAMPIAEQAALLGQLAVLAHAYPEMAPALRLARLERYARFHPDSWEKDLSGYLALLEGDELEEEEFTEAAIPARLRPLHHLLSMTDALVLALAPVALLPEQERSLDPETLSVRLSEIPSSEGVRSEHYRREQAEIRAAIVDYAPEATWMRDLLLWEMQHSASGEAMASLSLYTDEVERPVVRMQLAGRFSETEVNEFLDPRLLPGRSLPPTVLTLFRDSFGERVHELRLAIPGPGYGTGYRLIPIRQAADGAVIDIRVERYRLTGAVAEIQVEQVFEAGDAILIGASLRSQWVGLTRFLPDEAGNFLMNDVPLAVKSRTLGEFNISVAGHALRVQLLASPDPKLCRNGIEITDLPPFLLQQIPPDIGRAYRGNLALSIDDPQHVLELGIDGRHLLNEQALFHELAPAIVTTLIRKYLVDFAAGKVEWKDFPDEFFCEGYSFANRERLDPRISADAERVNGGGVLLDPAYYLDPKYPDRLFELLVQLTLSPGESSLIDLAQTAQALREQGRIGALSQMSPYQNPQVEEAISRAISQNETKTERVEEGIHKPRYFKAGDIPAGSTHQAFANFTADIATRTLVGISSERGDSALLELGFVYTPEHNLASHWKEETSGIGSALRHNTSSIYWNLLSNEREVEKLARLLSENTYPQAAFETYLANWLNNVSHELTHQFGGDEYQHERSGGRYATHVERFYEKQLEILNGLVASLPDNYAQELWQGLREEFGSLSVDHSWYQESTKP